MRLHQGWCTTLLVLSGAMQGTAFAEPITSVSGLSGLGSFDGTINYTVTDSTSATLSVNLTNTSPVGGGGYLTAFVFNNPLGHITSASLTSSNSHFALLGGPSFNNGVNGAPFGLFDLGASTGNGFEGGGPPNRGIGVGSSATFLFTLSGTGLDTLSVPSFQQALSAPGRDGAGVEWFVARFRGFDDDGGDKVPGTIPVTSSPGVAEIAEVPEPGTLALGGLAMLLLSASYPFVRSRKRTSSPSEVSIEEGVA